MAVNVAEIQETQAGDAGRDYTDTFIYSRYFQRIFATQDIAKRSTLAISMAPTQIHFVDAEGNFSIQPFVYGLKQEEDPVTWKNIMWRIRQSSISCVSFTRGIPISCLGLFPEIFTFSGRLSRMYIFPSGRMLPVVTCIPAC